MYSQRPKTGCPVFGAFHLCPVPKMSGFQTLSINRTNLSGYRTSGSIQSQPPAIGRPVPIVFNRTSDTTGSKLVPNRFRTGFGI